MIDVSFTVFRCPVCAILSIAALLPAVATAQGKPKGADVVARIQPTHPRILATAADFTSIGSRKNHPRVTPIFERLCAEADATLTRPVSKHELRDGVRMLDVSRAVLNRSLLLGLMFRLTGDRRYADRLWAEMDAVTTFPDWNPKHFLDTAEMTTAVAIAYDWLFDTWNEPQRKQLRDAMRDLGLKPGLAVYTGKSGGWHLRENNWNQVCNGGLIAGALAIAEDEPAMAGEVLQYAIASLPRAMKHFAPDGAWSEGPSYWSYATLFNSFAIAALDSATGTDYGLSEMPGFSVTGDMPLAFTGPLGLTFNYADAIAGFGGAPQLFWLATQFDAPSYAAFQLPYAQANPHPLDLLWGSKWIVDAPTVDSHPLDRMFAREQIVYLRSAWNDRRAMFLAFKGGDNRASHGQLDLGSFVLDALGQRWSVDIGRDDYNRPGYFDTRNGKRWTFYRCRAEGNNTLLINPGGAPDQSPTATADVSRFFSDKSRGSAIVDLTNAYAPHARSVRRGFALVDRNKVLIQDEIEADAPVEYFWFMHTEAEIAIAPDGRSATLTLGGETLRAKLVGPEVARFTIREARPLPTSPPEPPLAKNPTIASRFDLTKVRKLTVHLEGVKSPRIAVWLGEDVVNTPALVPLDHWPTGDVEPTAP